VGRLKVLHLRDTTGASIALQVHAVGAHALEIHVCRVACEIAPRVPADSATLCRGGGFDGLDERCDAFKRSTGRRASEPIYRHTTSPRPSNAIPSIFMRSIPMRKLFIQAGLLKVDGCGHASRRTSSLTADLRAFTLNLENASTASIRGVGGHHAAGWLCQPHRHKRLNL
jgi:hypothetical protein